MAACFLAFASLLFVSPFRAQEPQGRASEAVAHAALGDGEGVVLPVGSSVDVVLHGFARVDYGAGERFGDGAGDDQLGISKMALVTEAKWQDLTFVGVLGATILADQPVDTELKDIFVSWRGLFGTNASLRLGAGPLLFGLKPSGYPGDRSIVPSIEFGGAGAFPVSNQAGTAVVVDVPITGLGAFQAGVFDTDATTSGAPGSLDGSSVYRNYFAQFRLEDIVGVKGLYGLAGYEGRYMGQTSAGARVDETEPIVDAGLGFRTECFDLSFECIALDEALTETADAERYWIGELTVFAGEWRFLTDFARAEELEADTIRIGAVKSVNEHVSLQFELAHDSLDAVDDVDSAHARLAFTF